MYTYLGFNLKHPFFLTLRYEGNCICVDKEAIVNGVLKSFGIAANIPSSPVLWSYPNEKNIPKFNHDKNNAKQLLSEAGFKLNRKTNILEKNGIPFSFKIITNKGNKNREKAAQIIQRMLADIGIGKNTTFRMELIL